MDRIEAVLVVDDDPDVLEAAEFALAAHCATIACSLAPDDIPGRLDGESFDCILLDMNFGAGRRGGADGLAVLETIRRADPDVAIVLMTAYGAVTLAVEGLKLGASDFLLKPWRNEVLLAAVRRAAARSRSARAIEPLDSVEREAIRRALDRCGGSIAEAARALGLSRPALYRRLERHGL
jgi:DNA-binding NtrC family response regulator